MHKWVLFKIQVADLNYHFYFVCSVLLVLTHSFIIGTSGLSRQGYKEGPLRHRPRFLLWFCQLFSCPSLTLIEGLEQIYKTPGAAVRKSPSFVPLFQLLELRPTSYQIIELAPRVLAERWKSHSHRCVGCRWHWGVHERVGRGLPDPVAHAQLQMTKCFLMRGPRTGCAPWLRHWPPPCCARTWLRVCLW